MFCRVDAARRRVRATRPIGSVTRTCASTANPGSVSVTVCECECEYQHVCLQIHAWGRVSVEYTNPVSLWSGTCEKDGCAQSCEAKKSSKEPKACRNMSLLLRQVCGYGASTCLCQSFAYIACVLIQICSVSYTYTCFLSPSLLAPLDLGCAVHNARLGRVR